jgi:uncharacterized protein (DUF1800 family)
MHMKSVTYILLAGSAWLSACGDSQQADASKPALFIASEGQVSVKDATPSNASYYAAARFLEQASWGPSPQSVAEVQRLGYAAWIDQQLAKPPSVLKAPNYVIDYEDQNRAASDLAHGWSKLRFMDNALGGQDQLRQRMSWALYGFIVANGNAYATVEYMNTLQNNALGSFKDLLRAVTLSPVMGSFLNNDQNRADRPNENYARELMQLFSVGLVKLNPDGSTQRDAAGKPLETYTQQDVMAATKALSGWQKAWRENLPQTNWGNFGEPMRPDHWKEAHSFEQKHLLGTVIPAGQSIEADLESVLNILVNHPNTAPFVSRRLIQSLVSSNPSPQYLARVSQVFVSSKGNLGQVVRAILLDPEARAGDNPANTIRTVGKIKEPLLHMTNVLRAMGCTSAVIDRNNPNNPFTAHSQNIYSAPNVFGYFSPNHKAPESLTPAPEQKLLDTSAFNSRSGSLGWQMENPQTFLDAGCDLQVFRQAANESDEKLLHLVNVRFFKGAMPQPLREGAKNLFSQVLNNDPTDRKITNLLGVLTTTPTYGVVK